MVCKKPNDTHIYTLYTPVGKPKSMGSSSVDYRPMDAAQATVCAWLFGSGLGLGIRFSVGGGG
jgi:hypothetical protein